MTPPTNRPLRSVTDPDVDALADSPVVLENEVREEMRADERTERTRVAESLRSTDDGDDVPVSRSSRAHRDRVVSREDSGVLARAVLDQADALVRRQFGAGLPDEAKAFAVKIAREAIDEWAHQREEASTTSTRRVPAFQPATSTGFVVSIVTAVGLVVAILIGSVLALRITDRLASIDAAGRERMTAVEARLAEAENKQLDLRKDYDASVKSNEITIADHTKRIGQLEARQNMLTIYVMESLRRLLKERGIPEPDVPRGLRIAEIEAEDALHQTPQ